MELAQKATAKISEQTFKNQCFENGEKWYLNTKSADVHFTFGAIGQPIVRVVAHKIILATDSSVFERMFYGDLKEPGDVHVPDSTDAAFMEFLQYFYKTEVKLTAENVAGVFYLGEKYDVKKCVDDCVQFLMHTLDNENVCAYLDLAILYDKKELIEVCEKRILLNTEAIFDSVGFLKCDKKVLGHILKMDVLSCAEDGVFKACMSWVEDKIGCDDLTIELVEWYLGDLYNEIRLKSMTLEQLCALQKQYELVLTRDFISIANIIAQPENQAQNFNKGPRHAKWNPNAIIECGIEDKDYDEDDYYDMDNYEETIFSANQALFLGSLSCVRIFNGDEYDDPRPCDLPAEMEITEASDVDGLESKILSKMKVHLEEDDITDISLPHPVLIRPGFFYKIRFGPFPKQHHGYYGQRLEATVQFGSNIEIEFNGDNNHTLISTLNFNKI